MSGATFTITAASASAISFPILSASTGNRFALYTSNGFPEYQYSIWHIPGTQGNAVCNLGETGRVVVCAALYRGVYPTILGTFEADKIAFSGVPCSVVDAAGYTHTRCRLKSARDTAPPKGTLIAASTQAFFTAEYTFEVHSPSTAPV
jgi:hypothetical protein